MKIGLFIPGEPKGKARPRVVRNHAFTPLATKLYEDDVKSLYLSAFSPFRFEKGVPIKATITACFRIPIAKEKKYIQGETIFPIKKPDIDNIAKIVLDALNGVAYYDDAQVIQLAIHKEYGIEPGVLVELEDLKDAQERETE